MGMNETVVKIATIPKILDAETFLRNLGLIEGTQGVLVRKFMDLNPDIQELLSRNGVRNPLVGGEPIRDDQDPGF